jgi:hypothetical protein
MRVEWQFSPAVGWKTLFLQASSKALVATFAVDKNSPMLATQELKYLNYVYFKLMNLYDTLMRVNYQPNIATWRLPRRYAMIQELTLRTNNHLGQELVVSEMSLSRISAPD